MITEDEGKELLMYYSAKLNRVPIRKQKRRRAKLRGARDCCKIWLGEKKLPTLKGLMEEVKAGVC